MAPRNNPLRLNKLQLKTLALLQELAELPENGGGGEGDGDTVISWLPQPHGDHFHLGNGVVMARDASGLSNPAVWAALARKALVGKGFPAALTLTAAGRAYRTGVRDAIVHRAES